MVASTTVASTSPKLRTGTWTAKDADDVSPQSGIVTDALGAPPVPAALAA